MGQSATTELLDFTGGMNTLVAPHLISPRESTALINVDVRMGALASMPNLENRKALDSGGHFFEFNGLLYSYRTYRDNVIWDNKWYWSDGIETKKMLADGTIMDLGLPTPSRAVDANEILLNTPPEYTDKGDLSVEEINALVEADLVLGDAYKLTDGGTITLGVDDVEVNKGETVMWDNASFENLGIIEGPHTGDFKYTYTFYSDQTNVESAPAPLPNEYTTVESRAIQLTNFDPLPAGATHYRIYRIGGYLPMFTLVDITQLDSFTDDIGDTRIDGRLLQTMYCGIPPVGLENLVEFNGRFYGSLGNKIYYSAIGNPDAWYISDYFLARDTIVGLAASPGGILAMGKYFTMMFYGTSPNDYRVKLISDHLGCIDKRSIAYVGDSAIWLSTRSFVMCNGYTVTDITAHKIDSLRGILPTGAQVDDNTYYMSFKPQLVPSETLYPEDDLYPSLVEGTAGLDEGIIAMDFKRGNGFSYKMIHYEKIISLGMYRGEVHVGIGSDKQSAINCERTVFHKCSDFMPCSGYSMNRLSVYAGQGLAPLYYLSPRLADGSLATLKEYDKIRVVYTGVFNIKVLFDNGEVAVERDTAELNDIDGFIVIGIPNDNNKSQFIRFAIEGKGIISSIQYSWKPREVRN